MSDRNAKLRIVVAETSPVICAGMVTCLRRLPLAQLQVMEAHTYSDLVECIRTTGTNLVIANPNFCAGFHTRTLRQDSGSDCLVMAIRTTPLDHAVLETYDGAIELSDDLDTIQSKILEVTSASDAVETNEDKKAGVLSQREKEIVILVVKGLTNKDIADKLFLSVHTVLTHRRNIARKLDIHSSTGLTIYAIVNKLVDLSEIKM